MKKPVHRQPFTVYQYPKMMRIQKICFRELTIPLKFQFAQSNNPSSRFSSSVVLELQTVEGLRGFGESCPRAYVTGESKKSVLNDLQQIEKTIKEDGPDTVEALKNYLLKWEAEGIGQSTLCAVEMAFIDLICQTREQTLQEVFDIKVAPALSYSLILPLLSPNGLQQLLEKIHYFQPPKIKLKVNQDQQSNLEKVQLIRQHYGAQMRIRVDVNGGWDLAQAQSNIPELAALGVESFEQILAVGSNEQLAQLNRQFGDQVGIMADESLLSVGHARQLIEGQCCNHFNLKISKLGGIFRSLEIYQLAQANGLACQMGAHFGESNLLTSAGVVLASLCPNLTSCEGALGDFLLENDIAVPSIRHAFDGSLSSKSVLESKGWSEKMVPALLDQYSENIVAI